MKQMVQEPRRRRQAKHAAAAAGRTSRSKEENVATLSGMQLNEFFIALSDELNLINDMLQCVPHLSVAADLLRENGVSAETRDPLGAWATTLSSTRKTEGLELMRADSIDVPETLIEIARWRLDRAQQVLEAICRRQSNEREG